MSQGQQNRIALISALMNNPDVLILDESTNGLDTQTLLRLKNTNLSMGAKANHAVFKPCVGFYRECGHERDIY